MSLRLRLAIAAGFLSASFVVLFATGTYLWANRLLHDEVDSSLIQRSEQLTVRMGDILARTQPTSSREYTLGADIDPVQILNTDGEVILGTGVLPINAADHALATGTSTDTVLRTESINGRRLRIATAPLNDSGAVQLSDDITDLENGLRSLRKRLIVSSLFAGLASAFGAWWFAGRFVAPVVAVTKAAEELALHQDLPSRLHIDRSDEIGRLAASFNSLLAALTVAREQQQRLVDDASHELRTPLTSLRTKIEFLQFTPELPAQTRQSVLDGSVDELKQLSELVTELVDLAADTGSGSEEVVSFDLDELVQAEVARFSRVSNRTVHLETSQFHLEGQARAIRRALSNLLRNADKFSPANSPIAVTQCDGSIEVRDSGPGLSLTDQDRIFDRFYRGSESPSTEGSGIGLAIVARVAELHGGTVWAKNATEVAASGKTNELSDTGAIVGFSVLPQHPGS